MVTVHPIDGMFHFRLPAPIRFYAELVMGFPHFHLVSPAKSQQHNPAGVRFGQSLVEGSGIGGLL
jgi:hypothetical protein